MAPRRADGICWKTRWWSGSAQTTSIAGDRVRCRIEAGPGTGTGGATGTNRPHGFQVTNTGCIDRTTAAHDQIAKGYPSPTFNLAGYMIYDGPVRIFNDRFVNFKVDPTPLLDATDVAWLNQFSAGNKYVGNKAFVYEGDAALGWFQANPNPYPNATVSNQLVFYNVDLRHQIYTAGSPRRNDIQGQRQEHGDPRRGRNADRPRGYRQHRQAMRYDRARRALRYFPCRSTTWR